MTISKLIKLTAIFVLFLLFSACGLAGHDEEHCENPNSSQQGPCETQESSEWNKIKWDEDSWG